jgi:hypothetical protein
MNRSEGWRYQRCDALLNFNAIFHPFKIFPTNRRRIIFKDFHLLTILQNEDLVIHKPRPSTTKLRSTSHSRVIKPLEPPAQVGSSPAGLVYPEDGDDTFLRNVDSHKIYRAPYPRRRHSSTLQERWTLKFRENGYFRYQKTVFVRAMYILFVMSDV